MIPKTIHYCWFGGKQKPKLVEHCISSWKRHMPDYDIMEWNEDNYDIRKCRFMSDAYNEKKWAFVSDYCRIDVVNQFGGIYLDTDVEVIKSFDDLLRYQMFCGYEKSQEVKTTHYIAFGLGFGSVRHHPILKDILGTYESLDFYNDDGSLNLITCPLIQTEALRHYGATIDGETKIYNDVAIFSSEYFCPMNYINGDIRITDRTYSIHHYSATWMPWFYVWEQRMWHSMGIRNLKLLLRIMNLVRHGSLRT